MEINEYEKLLQRIWELRKGFYVKYGREPNNVNVGKEELYALKNGNQFTQENWNKENSSLYTVFGMKLKIVEEESYLSVGLVIE